MTLACWLCGSVGGRLRKSSAHPSVWDKTPPAPALMPDTSVAPCMPLVPFKLLPWCWSSEEVNLSKSVCWFFKVNCLVLQQFVLPTQSLLGFATRSYGDFQALEPWAGRSGVELGSPRSRNICPEFLSTTHGCGASSFHVSTPPINLDGCGFFNSVVVSLPLNSISDSSE